MTTSMVIAAMPAYNEDEHIPKLVLGAKKHVDKVVVVDDGSEDMTAEIAEALGAMVVRHKANNGYGAAIRT
ncbi:MAG: glycosyltransferase, partial [Methanophagales archaeon]|nr:glycosyltransferase [Methanophagales archaeon]